MSTHPVESIKILLFKKIMDIVFLNYKHNSATTPEDPFEGGIKYFCPIITKESLKPISFIKVLPYKPIKALLSWDKLKLNKEYGQIRPKQKTPDENSGKIFRTKTLLSISDSKLIFVGNEAVVEAIIQIDENQAFPPGACWRRHLKTRNIMSPIRMNIKITDVINFQTFIVVFVIILINVRNAVNKCVAVVKLTSASQLSS
ncbi:hypothetical protein HELRODRAFT_169187 [Helobdella robusta]|uniref:Uncharacterized protein n=1 Tax=Helobdella robusta TaxID=6412 RepID=T1F1J7_HELRO|nr:hypothetical protein HELRODRAFT_169187 [Helobdella robusta]ESO08370.1 hypothetical protein HELRODRAFT_169187 [Helobdella robusta]